MHLIPREVDKLQVAVVGQLAQKRLASGRALNAPEAVGLLAYILGELVRSGDFTVSQLMSKGKAILGLDMVDAGVPEQVKEIHVEGTFVNGTYLVTVHDPICSEHGDWDLALWASGLSKPDKVVSRVDGGGVLSGLRLRPEDIELNTARDCIRLQVTNTGDRPIQVGSHYHFDRVNKALQFDRAAAHERRLNIAAGTALRFEPGDQKVVSLVKIAGAMQVHGGNNWEFQGDSSGPLETGSPISISREAYCEMYGPTTGDMVRLGDTYLWVEVEKDFAIYGEELKFGGGKVIRDGLGQASGRTDAQAVDTVITNALIIDYTGIYKADIGIKDGFIAGIGKAGNPDVQPGVTIVVGAATDVIAGEGTIITAGGIDSHIHFICPQQIEEAVASGITTMIGGGTGPSAGTSATTCTPSKFHIQAMLNSLDGFALNFGITGKGNDSIGIQLEEQVKAGVMGLKLHEDWGTTPSTIDSCLNVCDKYDVQCLIHTDTLNESSYVDDTIEAFKGRTIHTYHTEGAGGGHAPDILRVVQESNVLPSSTNPTRPFTLNTLDEHLDMLMVCHHLDRDIPEDVAFAESRIRAETIAAEDILHDTGAISMMSSDSQAMGRVGEVILRTWKTAHKNKLQRGRSAEATNDNERVKRYISKYTINPAIAHGISHLVGSVEENKLADLVQWDFASFGVKPRMIIKSGMITYAMMGDANASIPNIQPQIMRPMFGAYLPRLSYIFTSRYAQEDDIGTKYQLKHKIDHVRGTRSITKRDMKWNDHMPIMEIDPETYRVYADGVECTCEPSETLPLTTRHFLF